MFLDSLMRRNPHFLATAISLHQDGVIPPNSYVVDVDAVHDNARAIADQAERLGLTVFAMTKQFGRNPVVMSAIRNGGIASFVAVDVVCARAIRDAGYALGHVGHLVQVPNRDCDEVASARPDYWTVFNREKVSSVGRAAGRLERSQRLLARVYDQGDFFLTGQEGGFGVDDIVKVYDHVTAERGCELAGVTTFPAAIYDPKKRKVVPTPNLATVVRAAERLREQRGARPMEVNAPGTNSVATLPLLADAGVTQAEPGHALTGTTPLHAVDDLPERPAILYVSEISHVHGGFGYCFGGGFYVDPGAGTHEATALVGSGVDQAFDQCLSVRLPDPQDIDYYGRVVLQRRATVEIGASVIFGFRPQAFVTRATICPVIGVEGGAPSVRGIWSVDGRNVGEC